MGVQPNLLLVMTDQQRADAAGFANRDFTDTPALDAIARRGTVFTNAYSASTTCVPSRSALMTGIFDHRLPRGPDRKALRDGYWNLAHALKARGYRTGLFGKMHFSPINARHGFDVVRSVEHLTAAAGYAEGDTDDYRVWIEAQGLRDVRFDPRKERRFPYAAPFHPTNWITDEAIRFLSNRDEDAPFFGVVSYTGPHTPHDPPEPFASMFDPHREVVPSDGMHVNARLPDFFTNVMGPERDSEFSPRRVEDEDEYEVRATLAAIRALIRHIDSNIERLFEHVDLSNTLVCFTSDHGDYGGHRGLLGKVPWIPFEDLVKVPLFYAGLGTSAGRTIESPVQSCDMALTFLEAAGALPSQHALFDSESLWNVLNGATARKDRIIHSSISMGWPMVRRGNFKMIGRIYYGSSLFDLDSDAGERLDVAKDYPDVLEELTEEVRTHYNRPKLDLWANEEARDAPSTPASTS